MDERAGQPALLTKNTNDMKNIWIDNNTGITYEGDESMVEFLRSQGDESYNDVSDEYIIDEAHSQGWIKLSK